jgi:hypothetical protein
MEFAQLQTTVRALQDGKASAVRVQSVLQCVRMDSVMLLIAATVLLDGMEVAVNYQYVIKAV